MTESAADAVAPRPFLSEDRVRWADVDLVGIMRFSAFTRLIENGEQDMWRAAGMPYGTQMDKPEVWMPRRNLNIEYTAPARIDDVLHIVTYVSKMGQSSLSFNVDVMSADFQRLYAAATIVTVCVDARTFSKQPLPDTLRAGMAPFALSTELARTWVHAYAAKRGIERV